HSVSVAVKSGHAIGTFLAGVLVDTTGSDPATSAAGDIGWVFAANKAHAQSLAAGETDTEVVTITLNDGQGGTVSQDVSVTVVGVNDAPTVVAGSTTPNGAFSERANKTNDTADKDQASGTIAFADPDLSDTHTVTQSAPTFTWSGGTLTPAQQAALTAAGTFPITTAGTTPSRAGSEARGHQLTHRPRARLRGRGRNGDRHLQRDDRRRAWRHRDPAGDGDDDRHQRRAGDQRAAHGLGSGRHRHGQSHRPIDGDRPRPVGYAHLDRRR